MKRCTSLFVSAACLAAVAGSLAIAQPAAEKKAPPAAPAGVPDMQLPPGMTPEMMQACMDASVPGPMHEHLASSAGTWNGKVSMWMAPGTEPAHSACVTTVTPMMDNRFVKVETAGEMPGMGPFIGFGITGFDNVSNKFQMTWVDNCGTGMMLGTGEMSSDKKSITYTTTYNCPVAKGPKTGRQVETFNGKDSMTLEMFMPDFATGKEFKMLQIVYTRADAKPSATVPTTGGR